MKTETTNKIYITPTDEDAKLRPIVEVKNTNQDKWKQRVLIAVCKDGQFPFVTFSKNLYSRFSWCWKFCRMGTGTTIPDGWRLVDKETDPPTNEAMMWNYNPPNVAWRYSPVEIKRWDNDNYVYYIVPIEDPKPKYRPFESFEEWWPHRNRWARNTYGDIYRTKWMGTEYASAQFMEGDMFLDDNGEPCEPFGVKITD